MYVSFDYWNKIRPPVSVVIFALFFALLVVDKCCHAGIGRAAEQALAESMAVNMSVIRISLSVSSLSLPAGALMYCDDDVEMA